MKLGRLLGLVAGVVVLASCATTSPPKAATPASTTPAAAPWPPVYMQAVADARNPTPDKVVHNLIPIVRSNTHLVWKEIDGVAHVLMATLAGNTTYYDGKVGRPYDTGSHDIWVSAVPELHDRCVQPGFSRGDLAMRLRQILGLTPASTVTAFVEFWVAPAQLFRPAPDNEVTDDTAGLTMPAETEPWYRLWFNTTRAAQYFQSAVPKNDAYPWTQLGYTYDWGNPGRPQGVSEFVIKKNSTVTINAITAFAAYCAPAPGDAR